MANESKDSDLDIFEGLGKKSEKVKAAPPVTPEQSAPGVAPAPAPTSPAPLTEQPATSPMNGGVGTSTLNSASGVLNGATPPALDDDDATRVAMERPTLDLKKRDIPRIGTKSDSPKAAAGPQNSSFDSRNDTTVDAKTRDEKALDATKEDNTVVGKTESVLAKLAKESAPAPTTDPLPKGAAAKAEGPEAKLGDTMRSSSSVVPPPPGRSVLPAPLPPRHRQPSQPPSTATKAATAVGGPLPGAAAAKGAAKTGAGLVDWDDDNEETHVFDKDKHDAPPTQKVEGSATIDLPGDGVPSKLVPIEQPVASVQPKKTLLGIAPPGAGADDDPPNKVPASASSAFDALSSLGTKNAGAKSGSVPPPPPGSDGGLFAHLSANAPSNAAPSEPGDPPQLVTAPLLMPNPPPASPFAAPPPAAGAPMPSAPGTGPLGAPQSHPPQAGYGSVPPGQQAASMHPSHHPSQQPPHSQHPSQHPGHHPHPSQHPGHQSQHPSHAPSMHPSHAPMASGAPAPMVPGARLDQTQLVRPKSTPVALIVLALAGLFVVSLLGVYFMMTPKAGTVVVKVADAKGANIDRVEIFLDGKKQCDTPPCRMPEIAPGSHDVKVLATGYESVTRQVTVEAGREVPVDISLAQSAAAAAASAKGTGLKVSGTQSGVRLFVDGKDVGPLPQEVKDLTPGDHAVKIAGSDRYQTVEKTVTVTKDEILDMGNTQLKVLRGKATIAQGTPGAKVYLVSGSERREVPLEKQNPIPVDLDTQKSWTLEATKTGMTDYKQPISFDDGQAEKTFTVTLEPKGAAPSSQAGSLPSPSKVPAFAKSEDPPAEPKTPKTPKETPAAGEAFLTMNSIPASTVLLDGKPIGQTPKVKVAVSAGPHLVVFVNAEQGVKKQMNVTVAAGETKVVAAKLKADE